MKLLLNDEFAPITSRMGFLEVDHARAADAFYTWEQDVTRWASVEKREVTGPLARVLESLLPFTSDVRLRFLWVPTTSPWTAYFDNSRLGSDASGPISVLAKRLGCRGLRIDAIPDSMGTRGLYDRTKRGRYGSCMFQLFGPGSDEWGNSIRSVHALNDGRWRFEQSGDLLPFEEPEHYTARRIKDRFPFELLDRYCRALGLRPFDEDFYLPPEQPTATLIERVRPPDPKVKEFTLAEVQAEWR